MSNNWRDQLDERQRTAVAFAEHYAQHFRHGATGHNDLMLVARLAQLLDERESKTTAEERKP